MELSTKHRRTREELIRDEAIYRELWHKGMTDYAIGKKLGTEPWRIKQWRDREGLESNAHKNQKLSISEKQVRKAQKLKEMQELITKNPNITYGELGKELDVSGATVYHYKKQLGFTVPARPADYS